MDLRWDKGKKERQDLRVTWGLLSTSCPCPWNNTASFPLALSQTGLCFIILPTLKSLLLRRLSRVIDNADALVSKAVLQVGLELMFQQEASVFPGMAEIKWKVRLKAWPPLVPKVACNFSQDGRLPFPELIIFICWTSSNSGNYILPYPNAPGKFSPFDVFLQSLVSVAFFALDTAFFPKRFFFFLP